jgi:hypothetical protein
VARENEATAGTPDGLGTEELGLRQRGDPGGFPLRGIQPRPAIQHCFTPLELRA